MVRCICQLPIIVRQFIGAFCNPNTIGGYLDQRSHQIDKTDGEYAPKR
jgi:hypothetical protein